MKFYLGTHEVSWLGRTTVPLFVSRRRFERQRNYPRALGDWALDSGGFTELDLYHGWTMPPAQYVSRVRRYAAEVGRMAWASPQDWMCEPWIVAKTGLSVDEHQRRTVANYLELRALAPELPFVPVLQGWDRGDYLRCVEMYGRAGVDLAAHPLVGVGSVCRRQATSEIADLLSELAGFGFRLHGFGVKTLGLRRYGHILASADSLAWSYRARMAARERLRGEGPPAPCTHASCANCQRFAESWRVELLASLPAV